MYVVIAVNSANRAATNCSFGSYLTNSTSTSVVWSAPIAAMRVVSPSAIARFVLGLGAVRATNTIDAADGAVDVRVLDATSVSITFSNATAARLRSSIEMLADNRNLSACFESARLVLEAMRLPFINADASNITGHLSVLYAHMESASSPDSRLTLSLKNPIRFGFRVVLSGLTPASNYVLLVKLSNSTSGREVTMIRLALRTTAGAPTGLWLLNATANAFCELLLTWPAARAPPAVPLRYRVLACAMPDSSTSSNCSCVDSRAFVELCAAHASTSCCAVRANYAPYALYSVRLEVRTLDGTSIALTSAALQICTPPAAPSAFAAPTAVGGGMPSANAGAGVSYSVTIAWVAPSVPNGLISSYNVYRSRTPLSEYSTSLASS